MSIIVKKRERTQNWAPEEKNVLFSLIKPEINAIENKKIDSAASTMKTQAWHQIYNAFRGRFSTNRDITRIKEQWRRMKAQAKTEMFTFAEKVRTAGPEEATKHKPSTLSLEIWRLLESARKSDYKEERSDESNEDVGSASLQTLLDTYAMITSTPEIALQDIKRECASHGYSDSDVGMEDAIQKYSEFHRKRSLKENKEMKITSSESKIPRKENSNSSRIHSVERIEEDEQSNESFEEQNVITQGEPVKNAMQMFETAQKEQDLKIRTLEIELQRAELQKQAVYNDLKAAEIKRRLIESQAEEYYRYIKIKCT